MSPPRQILREGALAYRALFNWTAPFMFTTTLLISPIFQLYFFVYLGRFSGVADQTFYLTGVAVFACTGPCVYGGIMAIANERRYGTLGAVLVAPRRRDRLLLARALPYVLVGTFVSAVSILVGCLLLGESIPVGSTPAILAAFVAAAAACTTFGLALGAVGLRLRDVFITANLACYLLLLFTAAVVPADLLPGAVHRIGELLPLTHSIDVLREAFAGRPVAADGLLAELAVCVGWMAAAVILFRFFEAQSRRSGSLELI